MGKIIELFYQREGNRGRYCRSGAVILVLFSQSTSWEGIERKGLQGGKTRKYNSLESLVFDTEACRQGLRKR